ncbi:MAG: hypothetical protein Q6370_004050 [Candidatus Sigynarchaeota archaeon]
MPETSRIRWSTFLAGKCGSSGMVHSLGSFITETIRDKMSEFGSHAILTEEGVACKPGKNAGYVFRRWDALPMPAIIYPDASQLVTTDGTHPVIFYPVVATGYETEADFRRKKELFSLVLYSKHIRSLKKYIPSMSDRERKKDKGKSEVRLAEMEREFVRIAKEYGVEFTSTSECPAGLEKYF